MAKNFKIAIVGGGPAGLTLGVLLHKSSIPFTIFEFRNKPTDEELDQPAGSLDMHEGSGLAAIEACGLLEEFQTFTGDCTEAQTIANMEGKVIYAGTASERPEISRNKVIKMMMSHVPSTSIKWGHKLISARTITNEGYNQTELDFGENGKHIVDLAVGADGAWSKIRPLVTNTIPIYAGMQAVNLNIRNFSKRYPDLSALCGDGTFMALANKHGIATQRSMNDSIRLYLFITTEDAEFDKNKQLHEKTPAEAQSCFMEDETIFGNWGTNLKALVTVACDDESNYDPAAKIDIKPLYRLPTGHTWPSNSTATLIGDAAHLMNPPAGEGVNIAMQDSLLLSQAIARALVEVKQLATPAEIRSALGPHLAEFEKDMMNRAEQMMQDTFEMNEIMFAYDNGSERIKNFFEEHGLLNVIEE